jgi:hypothetical protein
MDLLKETRKKGEKIMLYSEAIEKSGVESLKYEDYKVLEDIYLKNDFKDQRHFWVWFHMMCRKLSVEPVDFVLALRFLDVLAKRDKKEGRKNYAV